MKSMKSTMSKFAVTAALSLSATMLSQSALAGPILADDGIVYIERDPSPLNTTPVVDPGGNPVSTINYNGGQILLEDYAGNALTTSNPNPSWWNAAGVAYTTTTSGIFIEFSGLEVSGFTFNVGANKNANAWIKAYYDDGAGHELSTSWFSGLGPTSTPGFGVYVSDPTTPNLGGNCARITKIEVDPAFVWGVGNFGVAESTCGSVPAPDSNVLLGLGLFVLGLGHLVARRREGNVALQTIS